MSKEPQSSSEASVDLSPRPPWKEVVFQAMTRCGGEAPLHVLYVAVERILPKRHLSTYYRAKVRQVLQKDPRFERVEKGVWAIRRRNSKQSAAVS